MVTLLRECSNQASRWPITLVDVLLRTSLHFFECPGISKAHLVAFRRQLWPRQETLAQLEQYSGVLTFDSSSLRKMDPSECTARLTAVLVAAVILQLFRAVLLFLPAQGCRLILLPCLRHCPPAELRQLVEAVFAQESERVRVAVLQHLIDGCRILLAAAPLSIGECCQGCG